MKDQDGQVILRRLLNHVFLPLDLPGNSNTIHEDESLLLPLFNDVLQTMNLGEQESRFSKTRNTFGLWDTLQENLDPGPVSESIKLLDAGDTFALYIREQNCGLMITVLNSAFSQDKENTDGFPDEEEIAVISTFPASQPSVNITEAEGAYGAVFPYTAVTVPKGKLLNSKSFVRQLQDLNLVDMREASPMINKAGCDTLEKRDVADPLYVSKWLTATLADKKSVTASMIQLPRVVKKIRDNVIFRDSHMPFRRSGLWTTIKVVLQICLTRELGKTNGYFFYKLVLIKFMLLFFKNHTNSEYTEGLLVEMMGKVSRRSLKLENYLKENEKKVDSWLQLAFSELMEQAANNLKTVRKYLKAKLDEKIAFGVREAQVDLKDIKFWTHLTLKHSKMNEIISPDQSHKAKFFKVGKMIVPLPPSPPRHRELDSLFDPCNFHPSTTELGIVLYDFERSVDHWKKMISSADGMYIWETYQRYLETAKNFYKGDPIGTSRMILTLLKMLQLWDSLVIQKFPMLNEHKSGVNLSFAEDLLVPEKEEMEVLGYLEGYFNYRDSKAPYPSLIDEEIVSTKSFSARFAATDSVMTNVRVHILQHGARKAHEKLEELQKARMVCEKLELEIRRLECEYEITDWKRKHSRQCRKCRLSKQERNMTISVYEAPLPVGIEGQNAVVFELLIPSQIAILRDLLYLFSQETMFSQEQNYVDLFGPYHKYPQIVSCNRREKNWLVSLMSTKKCFSETHYKDLHVMNPDSDFIRPNGYNCCFTANESLILGIGKVKTSREGIKNRCTLKVVKKSRYNTMQFAIHGNRLTSNEVIAKQSECHMDLSLMEFVEFGSLRSEWKLQWRNIFRALTQCSLSLKEESVLHLICQSIWQAGPPASLDSEEKLLRQAHKDFECSYFTEEFLKLLDMIRQKHAENWKDHYVLLNVIFLTQRLMTFNPKAQAPASKLLAACRKDATSWSVEIQRILSTLTNAPRSEVDALRVKLIEVNVCCCLAFNLNERILRNLIISGDFKMWLLAIAKIHDNLVLLGPEHKVSQTLQNLLRRVDEVGVYLEPYVRQSIEQSDLLTSFVESHHLGSFIWKMRQQDMHWQAHPSDQQVYFCDIYAQEGFGGAFTISEPSRIEIDIIKGRFLVDGCPVGYLPTQIETHPDFQRVFSTKSFEVTQYAYQAGRMITRDKYLGSTYSFYLDQHNVLTIIEHREGDVQLEYVPHVRFSKNVPSLLVENYTHWYNLSKGNNHFEFFYRDDKTVSKLILEKPEYILELKEYYLFSVADPMRVIVDVNCPGYDTILQIIERLEHWRFINIWCDRKDKLYTYTADLPRLGLAFTVRNVRAFQTYENINYKSNRKNNNMYKPTGDLVSKEYRGMRVSANQESLETLIGLKSGLLLEDAEVNSVSKVNSILLIPHGKVLINDGRVVINMKEIRNPPFFAYEVDTRLKQLKAGESKAGWVYLAYLHALTSQAIPDPWTGVTGTERALEILQSGQCFSCEPLDKETYRTLKDISELSPIRQYYPPTMKMMETVRWQYPAHIAHDAFQLIVDKLIEASGRLQFLFPESFSPLALTDGEETSIKPKSEKELAIRAYWRRAAFSTELGRINPVLYEDYFESPFIEPTHPSTFNLNFGEEQMHNVMIMAQSLSEWSYRTPVPPVTGLLKNLLLNGADLKGIFLDEGFPIKEGVYCWSKLSYREYWLDLFCLARKVQRKDLKSEWTMLLTYFAFKGREFATALDHLRLLQTVAVNYEIFMKLDPPPFEEYSMTKDFIFNREKIIKVLESNKRTWESYLDRNAFEMQAYENELDFAQRLRPIQEQLVISQATMMCDSLNQKWPIDNCDYLFKIIPYEDRSEINLDDCAIELNILLKNWYRNRQLEIFLTNVESTVAKLSTNVNSHSVFRDTRKSITKTFLRSELNEFCEKPLFLIDLKDIILSNEGQNIDPILWDTAKRIFNVQPKKSHESKRKSDTNSKNNNIPQFPLEMDTDCPILCEYMKDLEDSWKTFHLQQQQFGDRNSPNEFSDRIHADLAANLRSQKRKASEFWETIKSLVRPLDKDCLNPVTKQLISSELYPRVLPLTMLPLILDKEPPENEFLDYVRTLVGAYAVLVTNEQQAARCVRYSIKNKNKKSHDVELLAELNNKGHENWNPAERPEWLLFEMEMDLMIRPIQAKVAERMENPQNNENCLLQLNMGEGKTYVIVPLLVLSLANGKQLCRVTVLKSLYQMNKNSLIAKIGGILLNRRVYSFPCRRDYKIGSNEAAEILKMYEECVQQSGVVMTLPEHRLSFELKAYEKCHNQNFSDARELFNVQNWLRSNIRDVLDESDEILHVKYQLVYTLGKQLPIGGGSLRWTVVQDLLKIVPIQIKNLLSEYGPSCLEYKSREQPFKFPHCRILKGSVCNEKLCKLIAKAILDGNTRVKIPDVTSSKKITLMKFLTQEQLDRNTLNEVYRMYPIQAHHETLLILRGFLACGVLTTSLTKRWRVNYGVNPTGYRRTAVPFRAKDVASDRTEFGHTDVALILTQLSYYYSGLTDDQLEHCFVILFLEPDPSAEYHRWISIIPEDYPGWKKISHLGGVNLNDFFQKTEVLFPALRDNVACIDFWLSRVVFPQESKQFGYKIGCSPWDLSLDRKNCTHPTTGFSGTNDSKILLPRTITQKDLTELKGTNGEVLKNLLLKENDHYEALELGITGKQILKKLVDANIRVLLDVGALMLELNNEQVAERWLKLLDENNVDVDAAVYFDEYDKLVVMDRSGNPPCAFELSTFRTRLDRCVIYLDDVHTRGTDLKIPMGVEACVTLGKGVTKDKLVQGCMRMRKLGVPDGHKVLFWASQEVNNAIKGIMNYPKDKPIGAKEVLQWAIMNNAEQVKEKFIHFASAGVYMAQKLSSLAIYHTTQERDSDLIMLAESCSQKEQIDLKAMYGDVRSLQRFPVIVQHLLKRVNRELEKLISRKTTLKLDINHIVEFFGKNVVTHSEKYVGDMMRSTQLLDEEQERELEHELEAQHQKQLPGKAKSAEHVISEEVRNFIMTGKLHGIESWGVKLPLTLKSTHLWHLMANDGWGKHIYATKDFSRVITSVCTKDKMDDFLRPLNWIASVTYVNQDNFTEGGIERSTSRNATMGRNAVLLLLSPFEVNAFMELFRSGTAYASLHMYAPKLNDNQDTLHDNFALILPPSYKPSRSFGHDEDKMSISPILNACLLMYSGSSYFKDKKEQDEFCRFIGFCPRPRSKEEDAVFEDGGIVDGFVRPEFLHRLPYINSPFTENPEKLIRGIIQRRFGTFSMDSHVGKVVFQCIKPFQ